MSFNRFETINIFNNHNNVLHEERHSCVLLQTQTNKRYIHFMYCLDKNDKIKHIRFDLIYIQLLNSLLTLPVVTFTKSLSKILDIADSEFQLRGRPEPFLPARLFVIAVIKDMTWTQHGPTGEPALGVACLKCYAAVVNDIDHTCASPAVTLHF